MSIAFITDTHFGVSNFDKLKLQNSLDYFETVFFPYLLDKGIKTVIHLGDVVHNRNFMDLLVMSEIKSRFFQWFVDNDVKLHLIVGNHDTYYKNTIEPNFPTVNLPEFSEYVDVINAPRIVQNGTNTLGLVPWLIGADVPFKPDQVDILIGHFEINGVPMQGRSVSQKGFDVGVLRDFEQVLSGHFHVTSDTGNIKYIGTQYQTSWSDFNDKKGFWVLQDNNTFDYVQNLYSPCFSKVYYSQIDDDIEFTIDGFGSGLESATLDDVITLAKTNYVRFFIKQYSSQDKLSHIFEQISSGSLAKIDLINANSVIDDTDSETIDGMEDLGLMDAMNRHINNVEFNADIDAPKVLSMMGDLHRKAILVEGED